VQTSSTVLTGTEGYAIRFPGTFTSIGFDYSVSKFIQTLGLRLECDNDGDGIPNGFDLDSDNDGISI
jgi:hypothetical protein